MKLAVRLSWTILDEPAAQVAPFNLVGMGFSASEKRVFAAFQRASIGVFVTACLIGVRLAHCAGVAWIVGLLETTRSLSFLLRFPILITMECLGPRSG